MVAVAVVEEVVVGQALVHHQLQSAEAVPLKVASAVGVVVVLPLRRLHPTETLEKEQLEEVEQMELLEQAEVPGQAEQPGQAEVLELEQQAQEPQEAVMVEVVLSVVKRDKNIH